MLAGQAILIAFLALHICKLKVANCTGLTVDLVHTYFARLNTFRTMIGCLQFLQIKSFVALNTSCCINASIAMWLRA